MRIACALISHLRAKAELHRRPDLDDRTPAAIVDRTQKRPLIVDALPGASGVAAGMTLERAASVRAGLIVLDADESFYRSVFDDALNALSAVADRVEAAELGVAYVRLDGLERLYGGEAGAANALLNALPSHSLPRVGVGSSRFCSRLAARLCEGGGLLRAPPDAASWLAPMPVGFLPVSADLKAGLRRFGLRSMGAVADVGADALADRFGREGLRAWKLCLGLDDEPFVVRRFAEPLVESVSLPFASASLQTLGVAADILLERAFGRPAMLNAAAESAELSDGRWTCLARFKSPILCWRDASAAVKSRMELDPPQSPVERLTLRLSARSGDSGRQLGLFGDARDRRASRLLEANRRMRAVAGGSAALRRVVEVSPWHPAPEMRFLTTAIDPSDPSVALPLYPPERVDALEGADGAPASLLVNGGWRTVERVDDRWTFDLWWLPKPLARDYYRVDLSDGSRLTLFRDLRGSVWYRQGG